MTVRINTFGSNSIQLAVPPIVTEDLKTALAVYFNGTNTDFRKSSNWTGATNGANGTISFWFKKNENGRVQSIYQDSAITLRIEFESDDKLSFLIRDAVLATPWQWETTAGWTDTDWHHVYIAWELDATPVGEVYIDGVEYTVANGKLQGTFTEPTTGTCGWSIATSVGIGNTATTTLRLNGCLSEVYINDDEYLAASVGVPAFRGSSSGKPIKIGADGSTPTGTQPMVYLQDAAATVQVNSGSGGNMTNKANITDCSTTPSD